MHYCIVQQRELHDDDKNRTYYSQLCALFIDNISLFSHTVESYRVMFITAKMYTVVHAVYNSRNNLRQRLQESIIIALIQAWRWSLTAAPDFVL
jgi:hypothetical protein